jgi:hypothetical protein
MLEGLDGAKVIVRIFIDFMCTRMKCIAKEKSFQIAEKKSVKR